MLSHELRTHLLEAVPSFAREWERRCADQAEYEARFPKGAWTEQDRGHEFRFNLAWHLGKRVARGELHEIEWLFAALEPMYREADDDLEAELTVGLLEDLIHSVEDEGLPDAAVLDSVRMGPLTRSAWDAAYAYTHRGGAGPG